MTRVTGADWAIRPAAAADLPSLPGIERAAATVFPPGRLPAEDAPHDIAQLEAYLHADRLWVVVGAGRPLGFLAARDLDGALHIDEVDVDPAWSRQGIGAALVRHGITTACRLGLSRVTLTTFGDLPWNAPFYRRLGFRELAETELSAPLRELLTAERQRGMTNRVAMVRPIGPDR